MPWFKVDDSLAFHRKVVAAGNAAMGLWVRAGSWCAQQLTDGFIPDEVIAILGTPAQRAKLVKVRLWIEVEGGCQFHEWNENGRQPTAESVRKERAAAAQRQAAWRARNSAKAQVNGSRNGVTPPLVTPLVTGEVTPTPTRPDQVTTSNEVVTHSRATRSTRDTPPEGFDDFWATYPRKVGKRAAQQAYRKALQRGAEPSEILTAARRYAAVAAAAGSDPRYIPHPATWLNGGRYDDPEPDVPQPTTPVLQAVAGGRVGHVNGHRIPTTTARVAAVQALKRGGDHL